MFIWHLKVVSVVSFLIFCPRFKNWAFCFFNVEFSEFLLYSVQVLYQTHNLKIFFQPIICVFIFFKFLWQPCKVLNEVRFVNFPHEPGLYCLV